MMELIKELFATPEFKAFFVMIAGFFSLYSGTIILLVVNWIKGKLRQAKEDAQHNAAIENLEAKYSEKMNQVLTKFNEKMDNVEKSVIKKIADSEAIEAEQIRKESIELETALAETKKALAEARNIDEILEDEE